MPVWSLACPTGAAAAAAAAAAAIVDGAAQDDDLNKKIQTSMNILTFATPVSIQPKLWALSLYHNTLTKDSFLQHSHGILQLLQPPQACLVPILGKKSGRDIDKAQECQTAGFPWVMTTMMGEQQQQQHSILPNCPLYLAIRLIRLVDAGDHVVAICQVTQTGTWKQDSSNVEWHLPEDTPLPPMDAPNVLYTGWLRDNGFL